VVPLRYPYIWLGIGLLIMAVVLGLSLAPTARMAAIMIVSDKTAHFFAFAAMMLWFCGVFRLPLTPWVGLGLVLFGLLIEGLQSLLPYRMAEFGDMLADVLGISFGWFVAWLGLRHWPRWVESLLPGRSLP